MKPLAELSARLQHLYPVLEALPPTLLDEVIAMHGQALRVAAGTVLFEEGAPCRGFPMVLAGELQVARGESGGRSLELYRVGPGELCVVSTSCLFGQVPLVAQGQAAVDSELLVLAPEAFDRWLAEAPFRRFVFGIFADRLAGLMALVEAVAFQQLDRRLAGALLGRGVVVRGTQQALADELGTVREIVTRLLKRFERQGWVAIGREKVAIVDAAALRRFALGDRGHIQGGAAGAQ